MVELLGMMALHDEVTGLDPTRQKNSDDWKKLNCVDVKCLHLLYLHLISLPSFFKMIIAYKFGSRSRQFLFVWSGVTNC